MRKKLKIEKDYLQYYNKLSKEEKEFVKKFYNEFYHAPERDENSLLKTQDQIAEANRRHNSAYRDALSVAEKTGNMSALPKNYEEFMQDASDEWDYLAIYKQAGQELAIKEIFYQAKRDLQNKKVDIDLTLARFLTKYLNLNRIHKRRGNHK
jgi:hypothetical protein